VACVREAAPTSPLAGCCAAAPPAPAVCHTPASRCAPALQLKRGGHVRGRTEVHGCQDALPRQAAAQHGQQRRAVHGVQHHAAAHVPADERRQVAQVGLVAAKVPILVFDLCSQLSSAAACTRRWTGVRVGGVHVMCTSAACDAHALDTGRTYARLRQRARCRSANPRTHTTMHATTHATPTTERTCTMMMGPPLSMVRCASAGSSTPHQSSTCARNWGSLLRTRMLALVDSSHAGRPPASHSARARRRGGWVAGQECTSTRAQGAGVGVLADAHTGAHRRTHAHMQQAGTPALSENTVTSAYEGPRAQQHIEPSVAGRLDEGGQVAPAFKWQHAARPGLIGSVPLPWHIQLRRDGTQAWCSGVMRWVHAWLRAAARPGPAPPLRHPPGSR
jgi:hypothetical protein